MNWYKIANNDISNQIKEILKKHLFVRELMNYYKVPVEDIDNHLIIEIKDLKGKFAEGNGKSIFLDKKLLKPNFFNKNFHFVIHEFFHWLKRRSESQFYFNDPEEVQSFVLQMVWKLIEGRSEQEVIESIYPIIEGHFQDKNKSKEVFQKMLEDASRLYNIYKDNK